MTATTRVAVVVARGARVLEAPGGGVPTGALRAGEATADAAARVLLETAVADDGGDGVAALLDAVDGAREHVVRVALPEAAAAALPLAEGAAWTGVAAALGGAPGGGARGGGARGRAAAETAGGALWCLAGAALGALLVAGLATAALRAAPAAPPLVEAINMPPP